MLTISEVAQKLNISNRQVYDLLEYGYLNVDRVERNKYNGMSFLFSESQLDNLDVNSYLAEISENKSKNQSQPPTRSSYKKAFQSLRYYDRFFDTIAFHPDRELLTVCFYLYHLNHYAKAYSDKEDALYKLKHRVLHKMYDEYPDKIKVTYLTGPDRKKVRLCDNCKAAARAAGFSYSTYVKKELYCAKCNVTTIEPEYYSLVEFSVKIDDYCFTFHAPYSAVQKWIKNTGELPQYIRETGRDNDSMYLYGRVTSRVEEKIFPLTEILEFLDSYLGIDE